MEYKNIKILLVAALIAITNSSYSFAANGETIFGLTTDNKLVKFNSETPSTIEDSFSITGLQPGENALAIDMRPVTNQVYLLGSTGRVYTLNTTTGALSQIGAQFALSASDFGIDFNPTVDRIRVVSDNEDNLRLNPDTGAIAVTDTPLAFDAADINTGINPAVTGVAYTSNSVNQSSTTLFGIDRDLNVLVRQGSPNGAPSSPNAGLLFTIGSLGVDPVGSVGFDISEARNGSAYASFTLNGETSSKLYGIDLGGGRATLIGSIGATGTLRDIAISRAGSIRFDQVTYSVAESGSSFNVTVERFGGTANSFSGGVATPVSINVTTANGSATSGQDYTAVSQTVSFNDGETSKTVNVPIAEDSVFEGSETFNVTLSAPTGGLLIDGSGTSAVTIIDNDSQSSNPINLLAVADKLISKREFGNNGLPVTFVCSQSCRLVGTITVSSANSRRFGTGTRIVQKSTTGGALATRVLTLRPSSSTARKLFSGRGSLPASVELTATDVNGIAVTKTIKILIN